ncbi:hypothetical protein K439DRAFT_1659597 [Ramaria rubella]|nr:hypothetical protein K439DRAFT_1659597 [Ramaria rubella]
MGQSSSHAPQTPMSSGPLAPDGPWPSDGRVIKSYEGSELDQKAPSTASPPDTPYHCSLSFSVPVSSDLSFLYRGNSDYNSSLKIELANHPGNDVRIQVFVGYRGTAARDRSRICLLDRDGGGKTVGFYTPLRDHSSQFDKVTITATVSLPNSGSPKNPLIINALDTNLGCWSHHITDLKNRVLFNSLSLRGFNAPIKADSVSVVSGKIQTENAQISGSYTTSSSLVLSTGNAPISAKIRMENRSDSKPTRLGLETNNASITTPISLVSTEKHPSAFSVSANTSNGPLNVSFPEATKESHRLEFTGETHNSACNVKLPRTYGGSVELSTDPYCNLNVVQGAGCPPVRIMQNVEGTLKATVGENGKGSVVVKTTNGNNTAEVGGVGF